MEFQHMRPLQRRQDTSRVKTAAACNKKQCHQTVVYLYNCANREQTKGFVLLAYICPQHRPSTTQQTNTY